MDAAVYETVRDIAVELVNSFERDDTKAYWQLYHELERICTGNENSNKDHPFQWETLGDFTTDNEAALLVYKKALDLAQDRDLKEYSASVLLAIAERLRDLENMVEADLAASKANDFAKQTDDLELRKEVSEFILNAQ